MKKLLYLSILLLSYSCFSQNTFDPSFFKKGISTGDYAVLPYNSKITDWSDIIQDGVNKYNHLIIGASIKDTFTINKPIHLRDNIHITINSVIKVKNAVIQTLTQDFTATNYVNVPNGSAFRTGQWVAISDTMESAVGGGAGFTRRYSQGTYITSIAGNRLNLKETINKIYYVLRVATIGTSNSVFISDTCNNITIDGSGELYGNCANQYNHGYYNAGRNYEQCRFGNGLAFYQSDNISISGITVKDFDLHGITTWECDKIMANDLKIKHAISKNWLLYSCTNGQIINSRADSAEYEDGFIMYYGNSKILLSNCIANYNGRLGFGLNSTNNEILLNNCYAESNGENLYIGSSYNCVISGFISKDGGRLRHNPTSAYSPVKISGSNNITLNGLIVNGFVDYSLAHYQVMLQGDCKYITFNGGVFCNTDHIVSANGYGFYLSTSYSLTPTNIVLNNVVFHDLKYAVGLTNDAVNRVVFRDCIFYNNTNIGTLRDCAKFYNCRGLVTSETGTIQFLPATTSKYGSTHAGDYLYPDKDRFQFYFKGSDGGNSTKIWCDWTSSSDYPSNNFRVNVDIAPGDTIDIVWMYDHNIGQ